MNRKILAPLILCIGLAPSGLALAQQALASTADTTAIAAGIRRQIQACWTPPAGFEGQRLTITLAFLGDGTLLQDPQSVPVDAKSATKLSPLIQSALRAVSRCAPFVGLDALGADATQRFSINVDFAT